MSIVKHKQLLEVNEHSHPDLLWALRGVGGNFGAATRFDYQLHIIGPEVPAIDVLYDYKQVVAITGLYAGDPEAGVDVIQPLRELAQPIIDQSDRIPIQS